MRGTLHNGRGAKGSTYGWNPLHNDRNFDIEDADNIDIDKSIRNHYWQREQGWKSRWQREQKKQEKSVDYKSFEDVENDYYEQHFRQQYENTMERYRKQYHNDKIIPWETWCKDKKFCPEETVLQIGNVDEHITAKQMLDIATDYIIADQAFSKTHGNCFTILDVALHTDEAVPHVHIRKVWHSVQDGVETIGQNKALEQAAKIDSNFTLPKPGEEIRKFNNYKITYSSMMREKYLDICEKHGLQVEREPEQNVKHNRSKKKLIADKIRENKSIEQKNEELKQENKRLSQETENLKAEQERTLQENDKLRQQHEELRQQIIRDYKKIQMCTNLSDEGIEIAVDHMLADREKRLKTLAQEERIAQADQIVPGQQKYRKKNGKVPLADDQQFS